jgi:hypothetical protein
MLYARYANIVRHSPLTARQKLRCWRTIFTHWLRDEIRRRARRLSRTLKRQEQRT